MTMSILKSWNTDYNSETFNFPWLGLGDIHLILWMSLNCSHLVVTLLFIFAADAVNCVFRPLEARSHLGAFVSFSLAMPGNKIKEIRIKSIHQHNILKKMFLLKREKWMWICIVQKLPNQNWLLQLYARAQSTCKTPVCVSVCVCVCKPICKRPL